MSDSVHEVVQLLSQMPTISQIKIESGMGIDVEDVDRMSIDEIKRMPKENVSTEVAKAMLRKLGVK